MTFAEACSKYQTRFGVDVDCDFDITNVNLVANAINIAARRVARDAYHLFTWSSALTLVDGHAEYDLLAAANAPAGSPALATTVAQPIFHCTGVHINGGWLTKCEPSEFLDLDPGFSSESSNSHPAYWVPTAPESIRLAPAPNATAVAALDNYAMGFREPDWYVYNGSSGFTKDSNLQGPHMIHDYIVDRAYLDNSKSYVQGESGYMRRKMIADEYESAVGKYRDEQLARYDITRRKANLGQTRRYFGVGDLGY